MQELDRIYQMLFSEVPFASLIWGEPSTDRYFYKLLAKHCDTFLSSEEKRGVRPLAKEIRQNIGKRPILGVEYDHELERDYSPQEIGSLPETLISNGVECLSLVVFCSTKQISDVFNEFITVMGLRYPNAWRSADSLSFRYGAKRGDRLMMLCIGMAPIYRLPKLPS